MSETSNGSIEMALRSNYLERLSEFFLDTAPSFFEQYTFLGLRREKDFRYADLNDTDFSGADLRGFDFTGSDLRGSYGLHTIFDESTILDGVNAEGSLFEFTNKSKIFFLNNPAFQVELEKLKKEDYALSFFQIDATLRQPRREMRQKGLYFAKALFFNAASPVARNNMLYCIQTYAESHEDNLGFLIHLFSNTRDNATVIRSALNIAGRFYSNNSAIKGIMQKFLEDPDAEIRLAALSSLIRGSSIAEIKHTVVPIASRDPSRLNRLTLVKMLSEKLNIAGVFIKNNNEYFDYINSIDSFEIGNMALLLARSDRISRARASNNTYGSPITSSDPSAAKQYESRIKVLKSLSSLSVMGIPLILKLSREDENLFQVYNMR